MTKTLFKIVAPDGTVHFANTVAERNRLIAELMETYQGYLK